MFCVDDEARKIKVWSGQAKENESLQVAAAPANTGRKERGVVQSKIIAAGVCQNNCTCIFAAFLRLFTIGSKIL